MILLIKNDFNTVNLSIKIKIDESPHIRTLAGCAKMSTSATSQSCCFSPDFATVLSFLDNFGDLIGQEDVSYLAFQSFIDGTTGNA